MIRDRPLTPNQRLAFACIAWGTPLRVIHLGWSRNGSARLILTNWHWPIGGYLKGLVTRRFVRGGALSMTDAGWKELSFLLTEYPLHLAVDSPQINLKTGIKRK